MKYINNEPKRQNEDSGIFGSGWRSRDGEPVQKNEYPIENDWVGEFDDAPPCYYNLKVGCVHSHCETCGWNPFVSFARVKLRFGDTAVNYLTMND